MEVTMSQTNLIEFPSQYILEPQPNYKQHVEYPNGDRIDYTINVSMISEFSFKVILEDIGYDVDYNRHPFANGVDVELDEDTAIEIWDFSKAHSYNDKIESVKKNLSEYKNRYLLTSFISQSTKLNLEQSGINVIVTDFQILPMEYQPFYSIEEGKEYFSVEMLLKLKPILEENLKPKTEVAKVEETKVIEDNQKSDKNNGNIQQNINVTNDAYKLFTSNPIIAMLVNAYVYYTTSISKSLFSKIKSGKTSNIYKKVSPNKWKIRLKNKVNGIISNLKARFSKLYDGGFDIRCTPIPNDKLLQVWNTINKLLETNKPIPNVKAGIMERDEFIELMDSDSSKASKINSIWEYGRVVSSNELLGTTIPALKNKTYKDFIILVRSDYVDYHSNPQWLLNYILSHELGHIYNEDWLKIAEYIKLKGEVIND